MDELEKWKYIVLWIGECTPALAVDQVSSWEKKACKKILFFAAWNSEIPEIPSLKFLSGLNEAVTSVVQCSTNQALEPTGSWWLCDQIRNIPI